MTISRTAKRSKSLEVELVDEMRAQFRLTLEDKSSAPDGEELIHSLEILGELSLPQLEILSIEPRALRQPYAQCGASVAPVRALVGTRIGPGFRARVLEVMGRVRGCTHFTTLVLDLAASHTLSVFLRMREKVPYAAGNLASGEWIGVGLEIEPRLENACIALQTDSPVIRNALRKPRE